MSIGTGGRSRAGDGTRRSAPARPTGAEDGGPLPSFGGYEAPRHLDVPDEVFDTQMAGFSGAQLKVLLAVIRHTLYYATADTVLGIPALCAITGLTPKAVRGAREDLVAAGYIVYAPRQANNGRDLAPAIRLHIRGLGGPAIADEGAFRGYEISRYTRIPLRVVDEQMRLLGGGELKVLLYVLRHTLGWKKNADDISLAQLTRGIQRRDGSILDHGTGLSKPAVVEAIKRLEARGLLLVERRVDPLLGHVPTRFEIPLLPGDPFLAPPTQPPTAAKQVADQEGGQNEQGGGINLTRERIQGQQGPVTGLSRGGAKLDKEGGQRRQEGETPIVRRSDGLAINRGGESFPTRRITRKNRQDLQANSEPAAVVVPFSLLDDVLAETPADEDALTVARTAGGLDITLHPLLYEEMSATERAALRRLLHEGVVAATALRLALQHPAGEIERQIALLDRRSYRDRAAFLVGAIEGRYAAPAERASRSLAGAFPGDDPYAAGLYGVCPTCGSRPCTPDCPVQSRPAFR